MDTSKLETADLDWAIGINRVYLKILGLWPNSKVSRLQKWLTDLRAIVIFSTMLFVTVIPGLLALYRVWGDMMAMVDNMQIGLPFTVTGIKFIILWAHKKELEPVVDMIKEDWLRRKTTFERDTMIKQARIARTIVVIGCMMVMFTGGCLILPPWFGYTTRYLTNLTDPGRPFLMQTYYLTDITETPHYEIVVGAQSVSIVMCAISYTGIDTFLCLLVFHICAQLELLKERLLNLDSYKDFNAGLTFIIEDHLRLIRSVDVIDNTFNLMLLTLLVFFAMLFCLQGFLIVTIIDGGGEYVSPMRKSWIFTHIFNTGAHTCLYCVVGEILIAKGQAIFYAAYNYPWYMRTSHQARNLMLIMIRAEKPLHITAGKMFPMTLSMFCSVIKTSGGYISVLLANR